MGQKSRGRILPGYLQDGRREPLCEILRYNGDRLFVSLDWDHAGRIRSGYGRFWLGLGVGDGGGGDGALLALVKPLAGLKGVNTLVVPLLCLTGLLLNLGSVGVAGPLVPVGLPYGSWLWSALQYSAYNLILALPVLVTLYRLEPDPIILKGGGLLGGAPLDPGLFVPFCPEKF